MKKNRIMIIGAALLLIGAAAMPLWAQNYGRSSTDPDSGVQLVLIEPAGLTARNKPWTSSR